MAKRRFQVPSLQLNKETSLKGFHWSKPTKKDTRGCKETQLEGVFYTKTFVKEAQEDQTTDCHAGNPCAHDFTSLSSRQARAVEKLLEHICLVYAKAYVTSDYLEYMGWPCRVKCRATVLEVEKLDQLEKKDDSCATLIGGQWSANERKGWITLIQRLKVLLHDDEEVLFDENEVTKVKALTTLTNEEKVSIGKESARNGDWTKISMKKIPPALGLKTWYFVKSLANNSDMSITSSNIPKSTKTKDSTLPNQDTNEEPSNESQRNTTNPSVVFSDSPATEYDSANKSSVCSTPLLILKKLDGAEPIYGPKTFKSILKSKSIFKAETLKGITINEPSSAPAGGKSSSASKIYSAPAGKLKIMKMEDDPSLAIVMKELNELKLQINKKKSSYSRNKYAQQCKRTNHKTCDHANFMFSMNANQHHNGQGESSSRSRPSRPSVSFPSCIHCGYNDHHSNDCLYYPICEVCGSYDHDTHDHNRIISLRRGINPRNPQHVIKNYETCSSNVHTTSDHNGIKWFRKRETIQPKNAESFKENKNEPSALRSKTPTKRSLNSYPLQMEDTSAHDTIPTPSSKGSI
ncbi:hypothetical protein Tco_0255025 [Tanacetum coccineum]